MQLISKFQGSGKVNLNTIKRRLRWMESAGNDKAVSSKGATGRYLIRLNVVDDYNQANGTTYKLSDMLDANLNTKVRDFYWKSLYNSTMANPLKSTDSIRVAKALGGYNWGRGHMSDTLDSLKKKGVDIYGSWDWVKSLPLETLDYINFILRGLDTKTKKNKDYLKWK